MPVAAKLGGVHFASATVAHGCRVAAVAAALTLGACASTTTMRDFTTDGCTLFPEGDAADPQRWAECCLRHDEAYWRGGTAQQRQDADTALHDCVLAATGRRALAWWMYAGVRVAGTPWFPAPFRWGYGWGYGRGYAPLTAAEVHLADDKLAAFGRGPPLTSEPGPC